MQPLLLAITAVTLGAGASAPPPDSFFLAKAQARVDAIGVGDVQVNGFLDRRDNNDLKWVKTS
jgi:hypothetical protein